MFLYLRTNIAKRKILSDYFIWLKQSFYFYLKTKERKSNGERRNRTENIK